MKERKKKTLSELIDNAGSQAQQMQYVDLSIQSLIDPIGSIFRFVAPDDEERATEEYRAQYEQEIQRIAVQHTGKAAEALTAEELYTAAIYHATARKKVFDNCAFIQAICLIAEHCGTPSTTEKSRDQVYADYLEANGYTPIENPIDIIYLSALYYFAQHSDVNPRGQDPLNEEKKADILSVFDRLDSFYRDHPTVETIEGFISEMDDKSPSAARETLEHIALKRAELIEYPLDKVNSSIWGLLERDTAGQIMFRAEKVGSKNEINILYAIDFDALGDDVKITKRLMPYDKRVYIAVSALFNAGNSIITLTQIYYAMGYTGRPGSKDLERINASVTKMLGANIYISNEQEAAAYKYDKFVYKGSLLPYEQVEAVANGQLVDAAIHLFREPPVITFAKQRKQVTSIDVKLLQSPISKTDGNLLIDDYLIERISRAKNGKQPHRILYKTLYEKAKITDKKQRQRAADKIKRYLEHYQKCGMITRYTMEPDGLTVYFTR